jgi:membrane peptidoglycan carboxypeptidase
MRSRVLMLMMVAAFISLTGIVLAGITGFVLYRTYADDLKPPDQAIAERTVGQSLLYDRTGGVQMYEFVDDSGQIRNPIPLSQISPYVIAATIATEDASFYENPGVNFRGLARAAIENFTPFGPGFLAGSGGSSITQQLAKNIYIDNEEWSNRQVQRKLKEAVIALELKRKYDDNQILEWYLNQVFYGNNAYGIQAAAERYFAKSAADLTLAESAVLAGLPQAPSFYNPANEASRPDAKGRQLTVLNLMIEHLEEINRIPGLEDPTKPLLSVTAAEIDAARDEELIYVTPETTYVAPHFSLYVGDEVGKMCAAGLFEAPNSLPCDKVVTQGGLRITTTLDLGLQEIGERVVEENIAANEERYGGHNGSLVAIKPGTGEILTYVGSRDYNRPDIDGQVDIATSLQSHGSTMKMFTYLAAFEDGAVPSSRVQDAPLYLDTAAGKKQVNNWNFSHLGNITIRKAMSESVNTAAVRTLMEVGDSHYRELAHRMGITDLQTADCGPTITLGACEVQLVDMTYAYSVLANNGMMKGIPSVQDDLPDGYRELDPVSVLKIEDTDSNVIYQYSAPGERQVVDPAYAYMVTDILSKDAITWSRLTLDRPAASKTGTSEEFRDGVLMGYTPDLAAGVWMGNADNSPMAPGTFSSAGSGPMWRQFMLEAHEYLQLPPKEFEVPETTDTAKCGGRTEVFKEDEDPASGACRPGGGSGDPSGSATPTPTPAGPVFPTRVPGTPTPTPTPEPTPEPTLEPTPEAPVIFYYTVKEGDTLESIAAKFGVSVESILAQNPDVKENRPIHPGDVLKIPLAPAEDPDSG